MTPLAVPLIELGAQIINRIWPDATEADKAKLALAMAELDREVQLRAQQTAVNATEAASPSLFVSGWRPAIGWCIAGILGYSYVLYPLIAFAVAVGDLAVVPPKLELDGVLWELMFGLLGLSGLRSVEKIKGASR